MSTAKEVLHHPRAWVYARGSAAALRCMNGSMRCAEPLREGHEIVGQSSDARQRFRAAGSSGAAARCPQRFGRRRVRHPAFRSFPESAAGCAAFWCDPAQRRLCTRPRSTCGMICTGTGWTASYYNKVEIVYILRENLHMKTVRELPDGRTEVETIIHGCNVTVVFAREDDPETMKTVTDLIMSAYAERRARETQG